MHPLLKLFFRVMALALALAAPASAVQMIPAIEATGRRGVIPIRVVSNSPQLESLAIQAFRTHGRYEVQSGANVRYVLRFTYPGSGNTVRIDVTRGMSNEAVFSETVSGTSPFNALLRAADVAVERTNEMHPSLRGYFASKITFLAGTSHRREVYYGDLFCVETRRLTNDGRDALFPRWSPDGRRIIYTSFLHGSPDIYLINLASLSRSTFAAYKGLDMSARFSPDGGRVAMVLSGTGSPEIWVSDASGMGRPTRITHSEEAKSSPCWSPDGRNLLFAMQPGPHLFLMSASGGGLRPVLGGVSTYNAEPDWIRVNGHDEVAFTASAGGYQIAVSEDFGAPKIASRAPFDGIEPTWLPDGRHLVYTARTRATSQLCILDTESGKSTPIAGAARFGATMQANVLISR